MIINTEIKNKMRIPYALRRVPEASFAQLLPCPETPYRGVIALPEVEKVGKNTSLELSNGRRCALHEGDTLVVVFGNRYATMQFEGYARTNGEHCDLLSMGGLCGLVESKHASVAEPTKLRLLGVIGDENQRQLQLTDYSLRPTSRTRDIRVMVVCGTSMDSGKTHSVMSASMGLRRRGHRVAGIKLTGSAAGRDTWNMLDAGADVALDFVDGGFPSTYLCTPDELLNLHNLLLSHGDRGWTAPARNCSIVAKSPVSFYGGPLLVCRRRTYGGTRRRQYASQLARGTSCSLRSCLDELPERSRG